MAKKLLKFSALLLAFLLCMTSAAAAETGERPVRVGLAYGSGALLASNLENNTGYGAGYRFGYFDSNLQFVELGRSDAAKTQLTVLKAQNIWYTYDRSAGKYVYSTDAGEGAVGCYHLRLPVSCGSFEEARGQADQYTDGFVSWVNGSYQVRIGSYTGKDQALQALSRLGVSGAEVVGTSAYAVTVAETGSFRILFQMDGGADCALGILPDVTGAKDVRTWTMGYKYRGGFRYERIDGGGLTVVNIVGMEDYVKGVAPYEMGRSWPLEALKTQATCARTYAQGKLNAGSHRASHFDLCTSDDCQVYYGVGSKRTDWGPSELSDRAVDETAGMYVWYAGQPAQTFYSSSHGGASEDAYYIWGSSREKYPYLCGVDDPYEQSAASVNPKSSWRVSYTAAELTQRLQSKGYGVGTSVSSLTLQYSDRGNVIQVRLNYANGQSNTLNVKSTSFRSLFGVDSIRFTVNGQGAASGTPVPGSGGLRVNGTAPLGNQDSFYVASGGGTALMGRKELYTISGAGTVAVLGEDPGTPGTGTGMPSGTVVEVSGSKYVFDGAGWGHQVGMSQYGAYAMANLGFSYSDIIKFYFPGVTVGLTG